MQYYLSSTSGQRTNNNPIITHSDCVKLSTLRLAPRQSLLKIPRQCSRLALILRVIDFEMILICDLIGRNQHQIPTLLPVNHGLKTHIQILFLSQIIVEPSQSLLRTRQIMHCFLSQSYWALWSLF
jgi:hypothetical protein